jgi:hypothetical protein
MPESPVDKPSCCLHQIDSGLLPAPPSRGKRRTPGTPYPAPRDVEQKPVVDILPKPYSMSR